MGAALEDPVIRESAATVKEWYDIWLSLYLDNQTKLFDEFAELIPTIVDQRAQLINLIKQNATSQYIHNLDQQIIQLKCDIVHKLDHGNRLLNLDLTPRDKSFSPLDPVALSPIELYQLHRSATVNYKNSDKITLNPNISNISGNVYSPANESISPTTPLHLIMRMSGHTLNGLPNDDLVELHFTIIDSTSHLINNHNNGISCNNNGPNSVIQPLSEQFVVSLQQEEIISKSSSTIFCDLGQISDRDICLYVQVYRIGRMTLLDNKATFSKQQSNHNLYVSVQDGSMNSINSVNKYTPNGLSRSRHSSMILPETPPIYKRPFGATIISLKELTKSLSPCEKGVRINIPIANESEFSHVSELYARRNLPNKINPNVPNIKLELSIRYVSCKRDMLPEIMADYDLCCLTEKRGLPDIIMSNDFKNDLYITLETAEFEKGGKSISKNIEASISLIDKTGLVIDNCIDPGSNSDNISCYRSCVFYHSNSPKWYECLKINVPLAQSDTAHIRIEFRHCSTKERDKKFLGFAFLPLRDEDGTFIIDKSHELYIYKCDNQIYDDESFNLSKYTSLPFGPEALRINSKSSSVQQTSSTMSNSFSHSNREIVTVSTHLSSTKLTQNRDLLNLLRWRELVKRNNNDFLDALTEVLNLKGEEIIKFLQDILDTLFDTFTIYVNKEDDCSGLIFKVLIHIFLLLEKPEYHYVKPILDSYVSHHFSSTLVHMGLLALTKKCLDHLEFIDLHEKIQDCFQTIDYVFQFVVQSKLLYAKATGESISDDKFISDILQLFQRFESMLATDNSILIPIQVTFLENFPRTLKHLVKVLSPNKLSEWIVSFTGSVGFIPSPSTSLARAKLVFMRETVNTDLMKCHDVRMHIISTFCRHLDRYIIRGQELELCQEVLEIMVLRVHNYHWQSIHRLYSIIISKLSQQHTVTDSMKKNTVITIGDINLNIVAKNLTNTQQPNNMSADQLGLSIESLSRELEPFINLMNPLLLLVDRLLKDYAMESIIVQRYSTCLLTIIKLMSRSSFELFMKKRQIDYPRLCTILRSWRSLYNRDWSLMQLTAHSILEYPISQLFRDIKTKSDTYPLNRQLSNYINLLVEYISHPSLQLESFSERKRHQILSIFGDLRIKYATQLIRFWSDLPKTSTLDLIPTTIQPIFDASVLPNDRLQSLIIPMFYDMVNAEVFLKSNSRQFERCLIDNIDLLFNLDRGCTQFVENFEGILLKLIEDRSPSWKQSGQKMIASFTKLMHLLIDYRHSLENSVIQSKKMSCLVELCNFYKDDRFDLHVRYLFKLCDMHLKLGNFVEAALTLKQYSDELRWSYKILSPLEKVRQEEQEWKRKEALYHRIINYFDEGKCWEEAIPLCKDLSTVYENFLVDFEKWSHILQRLSKFAEKILNEHRPDIEYFRIEFFGADLPSFIRNKEFIYRAGGYERLPSFIARMSSEFPDVTILNFKTKQNVTKNCPGQYMFISTIKPVFIIPETFKSRNGQRNINDKIIQYYMNNRLDTFSYDIPIIKNPTSETSATNINNNNISNKKEPVTPESSVRNLWVGRYTLKTKKQLPDILTWSEVVSQTYKELSPIENAIETIQNMNNELSKLLISFKTEPNKQIRPLTMRLQGVIEAPVNGGPSVFINAFLKQHRPINMNGSGCGSGGDDRIEIESLFKLKEMINQQFKLLETGLGLHGKIAPPEVMPLHQMLVDRLKEMVKPFNECGLVTHFPLDGA